MNLYRNRTHPLYRYMKRSRNFVRRSTYQEKNIWELLRECFTLSLLIPVIQVGWACSARSFMRFKSGKVKFVAVDEPSAAALDAEGLIAARDLVYRQVLSRVGF